MTAITDILDEIKAYIERQEFDKKYFKSNGNSNGFEKLFDEDVISHLKSKYQNENIKFITSDLFLSIHNATIDIIGNRNPDETWNLEINIYDKYDFTDIKNASDYISSTDTVPMSLFSSTLNNFAAISSSYGVIKPFNFMIKMKIKNYKIEKE